MKAKIANDVPPADESFETKELKHPQVLAFDHATQKCDLCGLLEIALAVGLSKRLADFVHNVFINSLGCTDHSVLRDDISHQI